MICTSLRFFEGTSHIQRLYCILSTLHFICGRPVLSNTNSTKRTSTLYRYSFIQPSELVLRRMNTIAQASNSNKQSRATLTLCYWCASDEMRDWHDHHQLHRHHGGRQYGELRRLRHGSNQRHYCALAVVASLTTTSSSK